MYMEWNGMWTCRFWDAILVFTYETGKKVERRIR